MAHRRITRQQADTVINAIRPTMVYLHQLTERMLRNGFVPSDDVLGSALKAKDAMQAMRMSFHYAGADGGVGRDTLPPVVQTTRLGWVEQREAIEGRLWREAGITCSG